MVAPVIHHSKPPSDIDIDEALVRSLLRAQHPDLAELPLQPMDSGAAATCRGREVDRP
jgi:hypothetical protein